MLLLSGPDRIAITQLNGSGLQPLRSLDANGSLALDFRHAAGTACWVLAGETSGQLRCAKMRNLRGFTQEQEIKTLHSMHSTLACPPRLSGG